MRDIKKAVILFSGGLDSTTCFAIAREQGFACYLLSFDYEQSNKTELIAAKNTARILGAVEHKILPIPMGMLGGSAITDSSIDIPDYNPANTTIPVTYVPARNTIFLAFALSFAEVIGAYDIFIGVNSIDYSGYPDCRPPFIASFEKLANLATRAGVGGQHFHIHTPLIRLNKAEIIQKGLALGLDYSASISCYRPDAEGRACGTCDSCSLRKKGFQEAGVIDPTIYVP